MKTRPRLLIYLWNAQKICGLNRCDHFFNITRIVTLKMFGKNNYIILTASSFLKNNRKIDPFRTLQKTWIGFWFEFPVPTTHHCRIARMAEIHTECVHSHDERVTLESGRIFGFFFTIANNIFNIFLLVLYIYLYICSKIANGTRDGAGAKI